MTERRHPLGVGLERPHELRLDRRSSWHDPDREVTLDARQPAGIHGPVAPGAQPLAQPVAPQREPGRLRQPQRRIVRQDPPLEVVKLRRGLESQLLRQHIAVLPGTPQGLHLATAAVKGEHQLRPERLPQRMLGNERLELGDHLRGAAARQLGVANRSRRQRGAAPRAAAPPAAPSPRPRTRRTPRPATGPGLHATPSTPPPRRRAPAATGPPPPDAQTERHRTRRPAPRACSPAPASPPSSPTRCRRPPCATAPHSCATSSRPRRRLASEYGLTEPARGHDRVAMNQ